MPKKLMSSVYKSLDFINIKFEETMLENFEKVNKEMYKVVKEFNEE